MCTHLVAQQLSLRPVFVTCKHGLEVSYELAAVIGWTVVQRSCTLSVYQGHDQAVWAVATAPVGPYFVTGSLDHTACLWTIDRTEPLRMFAGHLADVDSVAFHPNCNYVATASLDLSIRLWDINSGSCVRCVCHCQLLAAVFVPPLSIHV